MLRADAGRKTKFALVKVSIPQNSPQNSEILQLCKVMSR